jgi:hypothetical protein
MIANAPTAWPNRILGEGEEAPDQLLANPRNWRIHPKAQQDALTGILSEVGWVQRVIVNQRTGHMIDGHARVALAISRGEPSVPVVYVDLSEDEERAVLASLDPLSAMAVPDQEQLDALLGEISVKDDALRAMLDGLHGPNDPNEEWVGMPEFQQDDLTAWKTVKVHFASKADIDAFAALVGQTITERTRSIWYPEAEIGHYVTKRFAANES